MPLTFPVKLNRTDVQPNGGCCWPFSFLRSPERQMALSRCSRNNCVFKDAYCRDRIHRIKYKNLLNVCLNEMFLSITDLKVTPAPSATPCSSLKYCGKWCCSALKFELSTSLPSSERTCCSSSARTFDSLTRHAMGPLKVEPCERKQRKFGRCHCSRGR